MTSPADPRKLLLKNWLQVAPAPLLAADLGFAEELSQYATAGRYPDDAEAVTAAEARRAIQLASQVKEIVLAHVAPRRKPKRATGKTKRRRPAG